MAHLRKLLVVWTALLLLAGCASPPILRAPTATPSDFAHQHGLQLQVILWVDTMPQGVLDYQAPPCANLFVSFSIRAGAGGFPPGLEVESVQLTKRGPSGMGLQELLLDDYALTDHTMPPGWAQTRFSGHVVDAKVRETSFLETLTSASDWSSLRWPAPGNMPPRSWSMERTFRGVATGCPPLGWDPGDTLEVVLQLRAGNQKARLRSTGLYGAAG